MLNLYDYLTEEDNEKIDAYIRKNSVQDYVGNEEYLKYWRDNKKKLFHLLGGKLIYKKPFSYNKNEKIIEREMYDLIGKHDFISKFRHDIVNDIDFKKSTLPDNNNYWDIRYSIVELTNVRALIENKVISTIKYKDNEHEKTLQIQKGGKPIKAIQKVIRYFQPDNEELMKLFEDFRIQHSLIFNEKVIKGTLCISIHPLDFLTMSDNNSNWSSCMSWSEHGCYHVGTVEMMNSNNVVCAYLTNDNTPYVFDKENNYTWNNKKWRQLFYCTKEILVSGKAYPYQNLDITKAVLKILRELAKENWNRTYSFGIEEYNDMKHIFSNYRMEMNRDWITYNRTTKHNIIFDSKGMYNDMLNDSGTTYLCYRNKVKKNTIISYSGKAPCVKCMSPVIEWDYNFYEYEEDAYNERYSNVNKTICPDCYEGYKCSDCGEYGKKLYHYEDKAFCKNCWEIEAKICPDCGKTFFKSWEAPYYREGIIIPLITREEQKYTDYICCEECQNKIRENTDLVEYKKVKQTLYFSYEAYVFKESFDPDDDFVIRHTQLKKAELPINLKK